MAKEVLIKGEHYETASLITKEVLDAGWFTEELECTSDKHVCLTDWTRKLILEVLGDKKSPKDFKIYEIN